jgi:hypothetical protein
MRLVEAARHYGTNAHCTAIERDVPEHSLDPGADRIGHDCNTTLDA